MFTTEAQSTYLTRMTEEQIAAKKKYAGEKKASMKRRDHMHGILFVTAPLPVHLGQVISGFKDGNRTRFTSHLAWREEGYARSLQRWTAYNRVIGKWLYSIV